MLNVLKAWLMGYFYDFEDEQMVKILKDFLENSVVNSTDSAMSKAGVQLQRILERQVSCPFDSVFDPLTLRPSLGAARATRSRARKS